MSHSFVDQMLDKTRAGELRSPGAITTVDIFARFIRPVNAKKIDTLRAEARVVRAGGRLVWAEAEVLADGDVVGRFASTGIRVTFDAASYVAEQGAER